MTTIAKTFAFDAAHRLPLLPPDHKCNGLHGHTYEITIVLTGPVDKETGMIVDYADIAAAYAALNKLLDHRYLNEIGPIFTRTATTPIDVALEAAIGTVRRAPTTENLAYFACLWLATDERLGTEINGEHVTFVETVRIKESTTTWCEVDVYELAENGEHIIPWAARCP